MRRIIDRKRARRKELAALPAAQKLRILEEMIKGNTRHRRQPPREAVPSSSARAEGHLKSGGQSVTQPPSLNRTRLCESLSHHHQHAFRPDGSDASPARHSGAVASDNRPVVLSGNGRTWRRGSRSIRVGVAPSPPTGPVVTRVNLPANLAASWFNARNITDAGHRGSRPTDGSTSPPRP